MERFVGIGGFVSVCWWLYGWLRAGWEILGLLVREGEMKTWSLGNGRDLGFLLWGSRDVMWVDEFAYK